MPFRILEHRIKFFDGRPDEVYNCSNETSYKNWLNGIGASAVVVQGTTQQETIKFEVTGGSIRGLMRTNKTTKYGIPMKTDTVGLGDFKPGIYSHTFDKQTVDIISMAVGDWNLTTTIHDGTGRPYCTRKLSFKIVGPR
jgi:hypothetical protein